MLSKEEIIKKIPHLSAMLNEIGAWREVFVAMEEYATQKSIAFAEWINSEGYREYDGYDRWIAPHNNNDVYETPQLYEMFLKDKNRKK